MRLDTATMHVLASTWCYNTRMKEYTQWWDESDMCLHTLKRGNFREVPPTHAFHLDFLLTQNDHSRNVMITCTMVGPTRRMFILTTPCHVVKTAFKSARYISVVPHIKMGLRWRGRRKSAQVTYISTIEDIVVQNKGFRYVWQTMECSKSELLLCANWSRHHYIMSKMHKSAGWGEPYSSTTSSAFQISNLGR